MNSVDLQKARSLALSVAKFAKKKKVVPKFVKPIPKVTSQLSLTADYLKKEILKEVRPIKGIDYFDGERGLRGEQGDRGIKGLDGKDGIDGKNGRDAVLVVSKEVTNLIQKAIPESLTKDDVKKTVKEIVQETIPNLSAKEVIDELKKLRGNDRLDISNIRNGEQLARALSKDSKASQGFNMNDLRWHGSGGATGNVSVVLSYDLSSFLDGLTSVFTIPANSAIIQITSSSAPFVFRPTIDFTGSGTTTLTFDVGIDPASMLAQGQTILVIYKT